MLIREQEAWDQYMQPANLSLDPMASLWSSGGSPQSNNYFPQPSSSASPPDQSAGTVSSGQSRGNDSSFGMGSNFYASPQQNQGSGQVPKQHQSQNDGQDGGAGDTFMGASTPGPGGVGLGGWKWTVMDGSK